MYFTMWYIGYVTHIYYLAYSGELEKKSRDAKSIQESVDKLIRNFESEKKALEDVISKLESKVMSCVLERDTAQLQLREIQGMNSDLRMTIDKLRTQVCVVLLSVVS